MIAPGHGGAARAHHLARVGGPPDFPAFGLLWWRTWAYHKPTPIDPQLWSGLRHRPYARLAIFWGRYDAEQLTPNAASQHRRFCPPTATEPAVVVTTLPDMQKKSNPVPQDLEWFYAPWSLRSEELVILKGVGFPTPWRALREVLSVARQE